MLHLTTIDESTYKTLQSAFKIDFIKDNFGLAGGTSLALQIGHRKSIDLDFFSNKIFDVRELEIILSSTPGLQFEYSGNNSRMLFCFLNGVKCDFVNDPAPLINNLEEKDNVKYYSVADIAAMKMHTISGRGKKKDFFDIYALLKLYTVEELKHWFINKYDENQLIFFYRSILYFEDAEGDPEPEIISPYNQNWEDVKKEIDKQFRIK